MYLLSLTVQGVSGSASYAQLIVMDGDPLPPKDDNEISIDLPWAIFGLAAVVAGLLYAATRDYRALLGAILSIGAMITLLVW